MTPSAWLDRFDEWLQSRWRGCTDWIDDALEENPSVAREVLRDGRLPLRAFIEDRGPPGIFHDLQEAGALYDLLTAAAAVEIPIAKQLLDEDPSLVHSVDRDGNTPLHWACVSRYTREPCDREGLIQLLVAAGAQVTATNRYGETPLDRALLDGCVAAFDPLFDADAEPTVPVLVAHEDYEYLDWRLSEEPEQIKWTSTRTCESLLHIAVRYCCGEKMIRYLMDHGAAGVLESRCKAFGRTPLLSALAIKAFDEAEALLLVGADAKAVAHNGVIGRSAMEYAVKRDRVRIAEMLVERAASLASVVTPGRSLLCMAESGEMAELLMDSGLDPLERGKNGATPFDIAVEEGELEIVDAYLNRGVEPSFFALVVLGRTEQVREWIEREAAIVFAQNRYCDSSRLDGSNAQSPTDLRDPQKWIEWPLGSSQGTALHYAAKGGLPPMVRLLLDRGAEVNAVSVSGWTPLHDAVYYTIWNDLRQGEEIIRMLCAAGADIDVESTAGGRIRPLDIAEYFGNVGGCMERAADVFDLLERLRQDPRPV
jgi:ankyrin repeat protein